MPVKLKYGNNQKLNMNVTIPVQKVRKHGLSEGMDVEWIERHGLLCLVPATELGRYYELQKMTDFQLHDLYLKGGLQIPGWAADEILKRIRKYAAMANRKV